MLLRSRDIQCSRSDRAAVRGQNRRGFLRRFARDEEGALLIFGVYVFLMILMIGGIGIDLMRVERDRAALQYTLDRAVLAAADLDQSWTAQRVINEYFNKAGLSDYLTTVTVDEGLGYKVVTGEATAEVKTQFMHMTGVDSLHAPASSTAEERIDGVEISLILDVSGSMNSNSRLTNLKVAARDFIDEMVANTEDGKLAISIIPYATQVSVPEDFLSEFNISREHSYSNCVNFQNLDFYDAGIPTSQPLEQTMHFDPWYTFDGRDNNPPELVRRPVCEAEPAREIMIMQKNAVALKDFITNLTARGNTSIDIGMKWGTALLDPTLQPVVDNMIAAGTVDAAFESLPRNYNDNEALKVIVLMTDGQNTSQYFLEPDYRSGNSNIWWNDEEEVYSVYVGLDYYDEDGDGITQEPLFRWPSDSSFHDHAYGEGTYEETTTEQTETCQSYRRNGSCRRYQTIQTTVTVDEPGSAEIVTYPDLWAYTTLKSNAQQNYAPWMGSNSAYNDWYYNVRNYVGTSTKNARTKSVCDAAKAEQIIVFTIAFEAPSGGKTVLHDCASSDSHYFEVGGGADELNISDAFTSIASSIRKLRLTQ